MFDFLRWWQREVVRKLLRCGDSYTFVGRRSCRFLLCSLTYVAVSSPSQLNSRNDSSALPPSSPWSKTGRLLRSGGVLDALHLTNHTTRFFIFLFSTIIKYGVSECPRFRAGRAWGAAGPSVHALADSVHGGQPYDVDLTGVQYGHSEKNTYLTNSLDGAPPCLLA